MAKVIFTTFMTQQLPCTIQLAHLIKIMSSDVQRAGCIFSMLETPFYKFDKMYLM